MDRWHEFPAEKPPMEGFYLVYDPSAYPGPFTKSPKVAIGFWWAEDQQWEIFGEAPPIVTHWMTLPDAPVSARKAG